MPALADAPFSVCTVANAVSLIVVNAQLTGAAAVHAAHSLTQLLLAHRVRQVDVVAATRVAPQPRQASDDVWHCAHLGVERQACADRCRALGVAAVALDATFALDDAFCAALMNFVHISCVPAAFFFTRGLRARIGSDNGTEVAVRRCAALIARLAAGGGVVLTFNDAALAAQAPLHLEEPPNSHEAPMYS